MVSCGSGEYCVLGLFFLSAYCGAITIKEVNQGEDVFAYINRVKGSFDQTLYQQVIGASNAFKEGDETIGVAADDETTRQNARTLLANTKIKDLYEHPLLADDLQKLIWQTTDQAEYEKIKDWAMGQLKEFLLAKGDKRSKDIIYAEGRKKMKEVEVRGVDLATGHGKNIWDLNPQLAANVKSYYDDAKKSC